MICLSLTRDGSGSYRGDDIRRLGAVFAVMVYLCGIVPGVVQKEEAGTGVLFIL